MATVYDVILEEHRQIKELLESVRNIQEDDKPKALGLLEHVVVMHNDIEEEYFYLPLRERLGHLSMLIDLSNQEHKLIEEMLTQLLKVKVYNKAWSILYDSLKKHLELHLEKEETDIFPLAKEYIVGEEAKILAGRMREAKDSFGSITEQMEAVMNP